jgi:hypothetical protein
MRENRTYGSEGGEDISPLRPYRQKAQLWRLIWENTAI